MNVISLFSGCGALRGIEDARGRFSSITFVS